MSRNAQTGLTISTVAARTGLSVPVLRAWEERYGFPQPERLPGGHRRYREADVERILRVQSERAAGRSLPAAIRIAAAPPEVAVGSRTVLAGLRRLRAELPTEVIHRRTMLAISLAIEDEALTRADRPHLAVAFQHEHRYRAAQHRWGPLARTAAATIAFGSFTRSRTTRSGVREVAIPAGAELHREWAVVCDATGVAAVLAGVERPDGRFEAAWSVDPEVVRAATLVARDLASTMAPRLVLPEGPGKEAAPVDLRSVLRSTEALTRRVVTHLDSLTGAPRA